MIMLKKFFLWFLFFGLSFLVSDVFGWIEQGKAFLYIHLGAGILSILGLTAILIIAGLATRNTVEVGKIFEVLITARTLAITLFATWGATKLFGIDFFVAYQIMTFGQCLCTDSKKKGD